MGESHSSASNPSFLDIALPLAARGIPVIPVQPGEKRCLLPNWQHLATTSPEQIARWNLENSTYNVGCVAKPDGIVVLDCDVKGLMHRIQEETGHEFPDTFVVRSGGKGCAHVYFLQTELSRKLGNRKAAGLFDLQSVDKYVVGAGSRLDNGRTYDIVKDAAIADFPDWLHDWVIANSDHPKSPTRMKCASTVALHEDFDFDEFCEWYDVSGYWHGDWFITDECPVAGRKHEQSTRTGFFFDGGCFGFHCFASGCDGSSMTVGQVIAFLNESYEPYTGAIWEKRSDEDLLDHLGVEDVNDGETTSGIGEEEIDIPQPVARQAVACLTDQFAKPKVVAAVQTPAPSPTAAAVAALAPAINPLAFPENIMYGKARDLAIQMKMPFGLGYMALIGEYSAKLDSDIMCGTRVNNYTALIAPVGGGKNVAMDRAQQMLELARGTEYVKGAPAGTRALMTLLGDKPKRGSSEPEPGLRKLLLISHEMSDVLKAVGIENSTLASRLCDFWDENPKQPSPFQKQFAAPHVKVSAEQRVQEESVKD